MNRLEAHVLGGVALTDQSVQTLRDYISARTRPQMCRELGVTHGAIQQYERQYGAQAISVGQGRNQQSKATMNRMEARVLGRIARTEADHDALRAYITSHSRRQIGDQLGCAMAVVQWYERQYKVRSLRECRFCRRSMPHDPSSVRGGFYCCQSCASDIENRKLQQKKNQNTERGNDQALVVDLLPFCRLRLSNCEGIQGYFRPQVVQP